MLTHSTTWYVALSLVKTLNDLERPILEPEPLAYFRGQVELLAFLFGQGEEAEDKIQYVLGALGENAEKSAALW